MASLENFLNKNSLKHEDLELFKTGNSCFECDEYIDSGFINNKEMLILWICSKGHESKVEI